MNDVIYHAILSSSDGRTAGYSYSFGFHKINFYDLFRRRVNSHGNKIDFFDPFTKLSVSIIFKNGAEFKTDISGHKLEKIMSRALKTHRDVGK